MKKKNEMETKAKGAAQELDMDALENVSGGRVDFRKGRWGRDHYDVYNDNTGQLEHTFSANGRDNRKMNSYAQALDSFINQK